jgi:type IV pilus assembly protein PilX
VIAHSNRNVRPLPTIGRSRGVVLIVVLIAMVIMTIGALSLVRTVDSSQRIAGALAFKHNTLHAGDVGVEQGRAWLIANSTGTTLQANATTNGYYASRTDPTDWESFFRGNTGVATSNDSLGNTVAYVIHRLCTAAGDPSLPTSGCITGQGDASTSGNSTGAGRVNIRGDARYFYRITVRVSAPRNTVSFIQAVVSL